MESKEPLNVFFSKSLIYAFMDISEKMINEAPEHCIFRYYETLGISIMYYNQKGPNDFSFQRPFFFKY